MNPRTLCQLLATGRIALGLAMFLAPARATRAWLGADAERAGTAIAVRGLGARDVAIGLGTLAALERDGDAGHWVEGAVVADVADATASLLGGRPSAGRLLGFAVASSAAASGVWMRRRLEDVRR